MENTIEASQKTKNRITIWTICPDKTIVQKDTHIPRFIAALFIISKTWKHLMSINR